MKTTFYHTLRLSAFVLALLAATALTTPAATYQVGPTRPYHGVAALPALSAGDVVEIDPGIYNEVKRWTQSGTAAKPIIVRGVGAARPIFDATNQIVDGAMPHPRAIFQMEAHYITLENLEFKNARNGNNGAGIRVTSGNNVTVRNCKITNCDMGMMSDNNSNLLVEASEIASNGTSLFDGYSHNFYLGGNSATIRFCYIHDALFGQNFKTRAHYTELLYNYIADSQDGEVGLVDATETTATNSHAVMMGNVVLSKPRLSGYNSSRFIQFGQDSGGQHNGTLFAFNNTFVGGDGRIQFLSVNAVGASVIAANNMFFGSDKIAGTLAGASGGSNNWMQATASVPAGFFNSIKGTDPGFVNRAARNFRLTAATSCRNQGVNVLSFLDGSGASRSGSPAFEYVHPLQNRARARDGQIDVGAYEYLPPRLTGIWVNGPDCVLDFTTITNVQYDLEWAAAVESNSWLPVTTGIPGSDAAVQVTDTNGASHPRRFYRVKSSM